MTYLYEGRIFHRDSVGSKLAIEPGAVNWMVAGKGITHSERTAEDDRGVPGRKLFGIQTWVALPEDAEETDPSFHHHAKEALPFLEAEGKTVRLVMGHAWGERSPVSTFSDMFYADVILEPGAGIPLPDGHEDRGVYVTTGSVQLGDQSFEAGQMMVFRPGDTLSMRAGPLGARLVFLGGETLSGPRHIWWNFVASSKEKIEAAKEAWRQGDWASGRFQ